MESLREKTANLRRRHILEAASSVFAERGFERATIKDIARTAGISDGSIYNAFESKNALLGALLEQLGEATSGEPSPDVDEAPVGLRDRLQERWRAFSPETLQVLRAVLAEALVDEPLRHLFLERVLSPVLASPTPAASARAATADITQRSLVGALLGLALLRLLGDELTTRHWDDFPDRLAELFAGEAGGS